MRLCGYRGVMSELPPDPTDTGSWGIVVNAETGDVDVTIQQPVAQTPDGELLIRTAEFSLRPDSAAEFFTRGLVEVFRHYPALKPQPRA